MREIKFRAWDKEKQRMCRVINISPNDDGTAAVVTLFANGIEASIVGENYPRRFELMQYTGLKDKNGEEIYEGDIVKFHDTDPRWSIRQVVWIDGAGFGLEPRSAFDLFTKEDQIEVIGNIYENADLLE